MSQSFYRSEVVYNSIGDYPVTDQFDVDYSAQLSDSIYDNYVTGSLLQYSKNIFTGNRTITKGERGLVFGKTEGGNFFPDTGKIDYNFLEPSFETQLWRERAGIIRNVRLFSDSERFYDSLTPEITEYIKTLDGNIGLFANPAPFPGNYGVIAIGFIPTPNFVAKGLIQTFPFEPKVGSINRVKKISKNLIATVGTSGLPFAPPFLSKPVSVNKIMVWEVDTTFPNYITRKWVDGFGGNIIGIKLFGLTDIDLSKLLFSFGDVRRKLSVSSNILSPSLLNHRKKDGQYCNGPISRGWKYGLVSGMPYYTSCVFRRDRYGQLRDMLEQRPNTSFISDYENSTFNYTGNEAEYPALPQSQNPAEAATVNGILAPSFNISSTNINTITNDPPVRINFTRQTYIESSGELVYFSEKPENTWSSNLSTFATSSLPYFDGISRNRGPITTPPNLSIISTLSDVFGNITLGS
jgi:hypothetical protein